jgi:hypothetical protein
MQRLARDAAEVAELREEVTQCLCHPGGGDGSGEGCTTGDRPW